MFADCCRLAGVPETKRQFSKFQNGSGAAYAARSLRLPEYEKLMFESIALRKKAEAYLKECWKNRHADRDKARESIRVVRECRECEKKAIVQFESSKTLLPVYKPHVTK